jgi:hypothetical protein
MEQASPRPLEDLSPPELEALWVDAKKKLAGLPESLLAEPRP